MVVEVNDAEIKATMFDINDNKAPGPDGYTSCFFKKDWSVVGDEVCEAVKEFFQTGKLLREVNSTLITLIPETQSAQKVTDYRPIACCNVLYKCISKIIVNRIKKGLDFIVNINQSAFIQGRQIQDNILVAQELLKGYNRKGGPRRCSLKIDIAKAYDTVNWEFLKASLIKFGFHDKMINWIITCVTSSALSVCINGGIHGYFKGGERSQARGSYVTLFVHPCDGSLHPHHDDLLVLCNGDTQSVEVIRKSLMEFSQVSGLLPNMNKSTIFFGNVDRGEQLKILDILPFQVGKLPVKYLGIPLITKRLSLNDCKQLVDRVRAKIGDWKNKFISVDINNA